MLHGNFERKFKAKATSNYTDINTAVQSFANILIFRTSITPRHLDFFYRVILKFPFISFWANGP